MTPTNAARALRVDRTIVRPVLAYGAASLVTGAVLYVELAIANHGNVGSPGALFEAAFVAAAVPWVIATWTLHLMRAPRPVAHMLAGAVIVPLVFTLVMIPLVFDSGKPDAADIRRYVRTLALYAYAPMALAGGLGGLTYALIARPRA